MRISDWSSDVCSSDRHPLLIEAISKLDREDLLPLRRNPNAHSRAMKIMDLIAFRLRFQGFKCLVGYVCPRSEEHTSELQSLMRISYAVFCLKTKNNSYTKQTHSASDPTVMCQQPS